MRLEPGERVALIGSGGKTTLLFELGRQARRVLLTTTTRMWPPPPEWPWVGCEGLEQAWLEHDCVFLGEGPENGKVVGISPERLDALDLPGMELMLVEADGSRERPVKAHREGEPVIPSRTTLVIAVLGMQALGMPAGEAHRAELLGHPPDHRLGEDDLARILCRYLELGPAPRQLAVLNQADTPALQAAAERIGQRLPVPFRVRGHCL